MTIARLWVMWTYGWRMKRKSERFPAAKQIRLLNLVAGKRAKEMDELPHNAERTGAISSNVEVFGELFPLKEKTRASPIWVVANGMTATSNVKSFVKLDKAFADGLNLGALMFPSMLQQTKKKVFQKKKFFFTNKI